MLLIVIYILVIIIASISINIQAEEMLSAGVPHNLSNIDSFGFPVTLATYLIVSVIVISLAERIFSTARYIADENKRIVLKHFAYAFIFTGLSHLIEFFGALYLLILKDGGIPIVFGNSHIYLYPILVLVGYLVLCFSTVELFLAIYYVRGTKSKRLLWIYSIFPAVYVILAMSRYNHWGMASWNEFHIGGITSLFLLISELIPLVLGISYYNSKYHSTVNEDAKLRLRTLRDGFALIPLSMILFAIYKIAYAPYSMFVILGEFVSIVALVFIYSALVAPKPIYAYLLRRG